MVKRLRFDIKNFVGVTPRGYPRTNCIRSAWQAQGPAPTVSYAIVDQRFNLICNINNYSDKRVTPNIPDIKKARKFRAFFIYESNELPTASLTRIFFFKISHQRIKVLDDC